MKNPSILLLTCVASLAVSLPSASAQYVDLGTLGSTDFTIDSGSIGTYTQSATTVDFTAESLGDQVFGNYTASDWSAFSDFGIRMTVTGANPNLPFTITIFDSSFNSSAYQGFTTGLLDGVPGVAPIILTTPGANLSLVAGLQIGWDGSSSPINVSMSNVSAVPEPSTYALLALGGLAFGAYRLRRRF